MQNSGDNTQQIELDTLRDFVMQRLQFMGHKMSNDGIAGSFNFSANNSVLGCDFGMIGGFVFDMCVWDALMNLGDTALMNGGVIDEPVMSAGFNSAAAAMVEGYSLLQDNKIYSFRADRVKDLYPQGRNKAKPVQDPKMKKRFNKVANQNFAGSKSKEAEILALMDILKKLEALQKSHVRTVTLDKKKSVYKTVTALHKRVVKDGGVDMMMGGLRMAV